MRSVAVVTVVAVGFFATPAFGFAPTPTTPVWKQRQSQSFGSKGLLRSASVSDSDNSEHVNVQVFDSAFSPVVCEVLHALAVEHSFRADSDTCVFVRPPFNTKPLTPLEHAMDSALTALNDTSRTVEYWNREEYMNIEAHADIDENSLEDEGVLRCPKAAHILYLKIKPGLRGPTCVFPEKQVGWGLHKQQQQQQDNNVVDLVTVPAVQGRILRFPGSSMHAVPFPAHRWLMTDEEEKALVKEEQEEEDYEDDYEDDEDENDDYEEEEEEQDEEIERSVLLFNTWSDDVAPPLGATADYTTSDFPEGIELDDGMDSPDAREAQRLAEWEADYGVNAERLRCNPLLEWREESILSIIDGEEAETNEVELPEMKIRVNLMGEENRRVHPTKTARLDGPVESLRDALEQKTRVTRFGLRE
jgi:hypothetical protein